MESLLGFNLAKDTLHPTPLLPPDWKDFKLHYRFHETMYHITVVQTAVGEIKQVSMDGARQQEDAVILVDDHKEHDIVWQIPGKGTGSN